MLHCHVMDHQMGGMVMLYNVLNDGDSVMHSMVEYRVPKTDMNVRAAPRPPMAQAILSINAGMSLTKDRFMILISIIFILI